MEDGVNKGLDTSLIEKESSNSVFHVFDHSNTIASTSSSMSLIFDLQKIAELLNGSTAVKPVWAGDEFIENLSPHEVGISDYEVYFGDGSSFAPIYIGESQSLDFRSPVIADSVHYGANDMQGDGYTAVGQDSISGDNIFTDEIFIYAHQLQTGADALKIEANDAIIEQDALNQVLARVGGIEIIHVQGQNNTLNLKLENLINLSDISTQVHILGEGQNVINLNLSGQGFTEQTKLGFTTYTNGTFSIIVEDTMNRGGIIV